MVTCGTQRHCCLCGQHLGDRLRVRVESIRLEREQIQRTHRVLLDVELERQSAEHSCLDRFAGETRPPCLGPKIIRPYDEILVRSIEAWPLAELLLHGIEFFRQSRGSGVRFDLPPAGHHEDVGAVGVRHQFDRSGGDTAQRIRETAGTVELACQLRHLATEVLGFRRRIHE